MNANLPFPRGMTYEDSGFVTPGDTKFEHLEGQIYECEDTVHGTGRTILLRVVKNDTTDITVARKFMKFSSSSAKDFGGRIAGYCTVAGQLCKPLDDAYTVGQILPAGEHFYVIEEGYVNVNTNAGSISLDSGDAVATTADGRIYGSKAFAGQYIAGVADMPMSTANTASRIWVDRGFSGVNGS